MWFKKEKTLRGQFGGLSDDQWLDVLIKSVEQPVIKGVRMPSFAAAEVQKETVGAANKDALKAAHVFYVYAKAACQRYGSVLQEGSQILDFGVSWGRICRFFLKDVDISGIHGVDVNDRYLEMARQSGCAGHLSLIEPLGRLPYDGPTFNLTYAYSVFTHLPEHVQDNWLAEIARTLRPGGLLVATVEPPRFFDFFAEMNPNDPSLHPWHAVMARKTQADPSLRTRLASDGHVYIPWDGEVGEVYGDTVMTSNYVHEHWGRHFEVLEYLDDPKQFWQAVVVARKR